MKKAISLVAVFLLLTTMYFQVFSQVNASGDSYITMEFDKTLVKVDDIITATIKINNIPKFSGCQVNIKFDPEVLQAVNPRTGDAYKTTTIPLAGDLLNNPDYFALPKGAHNLDKGILNISKWYANIGDYEKSGVEENTGSIAILGFKLLKEQATSITFEDISFMPTAIDGTILFDWGGNRITSGYEVRQPSKIEIEVPPTPTQTVTQTQTPTQTPTVTPTPTKTPVPTAVTDSSYIEIDLNKNTAVVGDIVEAYIKINNIDNFAGYHVNIKYDTSILQAVNLHDGKAYISGTLPSDGNLLVDTAYHPFGTAANDVGRGILNIAKAYINLEKYRLDKAPEESGTLAVIGFKVLAEGNTNICFENANSIPNGISGTMLSDWNGNRINSGYTVRQSGSLITTKSIASPTKTPIITPTPAKTVTPTPTLAPTLAPTPTPAQTPTPTGFQVKIDSDEAYNGEQLTVPVRFINVPAKGVSTADMTIRYDSSKLKYLSATAGSIVTNSDTNLAIHKESDGVLKVLFLDYSMNNGYIKSDGVFARLKFEATNTKKTTTTIEVIKSTFGDRELKSVRSTITPGEITLNYKATITPAPTKTPTPTVKVTPTKTTSVRTTPNSGTITEPDEDIPAGAKTGEHSAYLKGYTDGCFRPKKEITRAEAAVIISKFVDKDKLTNTSIIKFPDVSEKHWAKESIELVTKAGLFKGYPDTSFKPDETITRGEFAAVIYNFLDLESSTGLVNNFKDIDDHWAKSYILKLASLKYINGYSDETFRPNNKIKRDECVVLVNRALNRGPLNGAKLEFIDVPESYWAYKDIAEGSIDHKYYINAAGEEVIIH